MRFVFLIAIIFYNSAVIADIKIDKKVLEAYSKPSQYLDVRISPKGTYLASTGRNNDGVVLLTVLDLKKQEIISITRGRGRESVNSFTWINDERLLLTMAREIGSFEQPFLTGELIAMDAGGKNKTILTGYRAESGDMRFSQIIDFLPEEPDAVLIFSVDLTASEPYLDIYRMKVSNGRKRGEGRIPLRSYSGTGVQVFTNSNGHVLVATGQDPNENNKQIMVARKDVNSDWKVIKETDAYAPSFRPITLMADNKTMIGLSTIDTATWSLATLNIEAKKHETIASHPKVDTTPILWQQGGNVSEIFGVAYEYKEISAEFFGGVENTEDQRIIASIVKAFPNQSVSLTSTTSDNSKFIIRAGNANQPTRFFMFDKAVKKLVPLLNSREWIDPKTMPQSQLITYKARDGLEISAVLTLPADKKANDLPLIMLPHGGPHGPFDTITRIDSDAKVLASHGYAVLQPNFRGSGGYGLEFETKGFRNWGTTMIDDMTDGTLHLVKEGIVDKDRICTYGGSYGGYAAIQSVIREQELYQCAIGFVGVYDLDMMEELGDIPKRLSGRNYLSEVLPTGESRDFQSPIENVDKINVPVFIIQGEEDQRVPKEQALALKAELKKRNKPVEFMMKSGEGHGFFKPENNIERWTAMLTFLDKHIGK